MRRSKGKAHAHARTHIRSHAHTLARAQMRRVLETRGKARVSIHKCQMSNNLVLPQRERCNRGTVGEEKGGQRPRRWAYRSACSQDSGKEERDEGIDSDSTATALPLAQGTVYRACASRRLDLDVHLPNKMPSLMSKATRTTHPHVWQSWSSVELGRDLQRFCGGAL